MSGAKCASYRVISPEERRRRALLAAQSRLSRLEAGAATLKVEIEGVRSAYDAALDTEIAIAGPRTDEPDEWEVVSDGLESRLQSARQSIGSVVSAARSRQLVGMFANIDGARSDK